MSELDKAIVQNIPVTIEINGKEVEEIKPEDICPWYQPPKPKKKWRRRVSRISQPL